MADLLGEVVADLEADEDRHRERFREERLQDLLPESLSYHFQKSRRHSGDAGTHPPAQ
jgi:hypothetical protein